MIRFQFESSYRGSSDYSVTGDGERYRVSIRHGFEDEDVKAYSPVGWIEVTTSCGILRGRHGRDNGLVSPAVLDAFNAWRLSKFNAMIAEGRLKSSPETFARFYAPLKPPTPAKAGQWTNGEGWKAVDPHAPAVAA